MIAPSSSQNPPNDEPPPEEGVPPESFRWHVVYAES
jgi:hypothetical protein